MLKDTLQHMNLGFLAAGALLLFLAVFVAITLRALCAPKSEMDRCAALPTDED